MPDEWEIERLVKKIHELELENSYLKKLNSQYCLSSQNERTKYRKASMDASKYRQLSDKLREENENLKSRLKKETVLK